MRKRGKSKNLYNFKNASFNKHKTILVSLVDENTEQMSSD